MVEVLKLFAVVLTLVKFLGPWGLLGLLSAIVVVFFVLRVFGDKIWEALINHTAHSLGMALKDPTVTIRSVTPASKPDPSVFRTGDDDEDDAFEADLEASGMPEGEYEWYKIDAEITAQPNAEGHPVLWNPQGIQLRKDDGQPRSPLEFDLDCLVAECELWKDGEFVVTGDYGSVLGSARLRFYVGVTPGTRDVRFWYMGESFGHIRLPTRARVTA